MLRSAFSAFIVVCICFAVMQIPGQSYVPVPVSGAAGPTYDFLPLPTVGGCPGGVCPVQPAVVVRSVRAEVVSPQITTATPVIRSANHWSYPGDIGSHMANVHGVSTAGMSMEQALTLHDQLHEGRASTVRSTYQPVQTYAYTRSTYRTSRPVLSFVGRPLARIVQARPVRSFVRRVFCR